jgi:hypothetical protein
MLANWARDGELVCVYLNEGILLVYCSAEPQIYKAGTGGFVAVRSQEALDSFLPVLVGQLTFRIAPFSTYGGFATWDEGFNALVQGADFWCTVTLLIEATGNSFQQIWQQNQGSIDLRALAGELEALRRLMRKEATEPSHDVAIGEVAAAQTAAGEGTRASPKRRQAGPSTFQPRSALALLRQRSKRHSACESERAA